MLKSLTLLLVNCCDLTGGHFPLVNLHQAGTKSPLKWYNKPGKKYRILESLVKRVPLKNMVYKY